MNIKPHIVIMDDIHMEPTDKEKQLLKTYFNETIKPMIKSGKIVIYPPVNSKG